MDYCGSGTRAAESVVLGENTVGPILDKNLCSTQFFMKCCVGTVPCAFARPLKTGG